MIDTTPAPLPADQETAHGRLMTTIEQHQEDGYRIPCRGPEGALWLGRTVQQRRAAEECAWCPALEACRAYALTYQEECGVWGGLTDTTRKQAPGGRRRRRAPIEAPTTPRPIEAAQEAHQ